MSNHPWYSLPLWRKLRKLQLSEYPLCHLCEKIGRTVPATTVDHVIPHKGDWNLFIERTNHQSVCTACHNAAKAMQEIHGYSQACDVGGFPIDAGHPWHKEGGE